MVLAGLREIQDRCGYLPAEEMEFLAMRLGKSLASVYEVASYYPTFRLKEPPEIEVRICRDLSCYLRGSSGILADETKRFREDESVSVEGVSCLGHCDHSPVASLARHEAAEGQVGMSREGTYRITAEIGVTKMVEAFRSGQVVESPNLDEHGSEAPGTGRHPWQIDAYDRSVHPSDQFPPYEAVRRFVRGELTPGSLILALDQAELEGLGGAAGRAGNKWKSVQELPVGPKYVVCNGDESEPGTFKDRELMIHAPHLIVEAIVLGLLYLKASEGYIYVRHEYRASIESLRSAVRDAERWFLEEGLFGPKLPFRVEVVESPGGYICGEQSSLLEAIEGRRAQPRLRNSARDIQTNGLFDKPTILNNAETLAWIPSILLKGPAWYASQGYGQAGLTGADCDARYKGRRFFSISGDVVRPGVYEVPIGIPLRELVEQYAAGMAGGQALRAVATSGPSSGFLPPELDASGLRRKLQAGLRTAGTRDQKVKPRLQRFLAEKLPKFGFVSVLDLELATPLFRALGLMLGAGIVVFGDRSTRDMVGPARSASEFYCNESCGKCVPCRLGTRQLAELATRLDDGGYTQDQWDAEGAGALIEGLGVSMDLTSICSLGRIAANPLATLILHFPDDVRRRLAIGDGSNLGPEGSP